MRSLVAVVSVALALMVPASAAFARPADGPTGLGSGAQAVEDSLTPSRGAAAAVRRSATSSSASAGSRSARPASRARAWSPLAPRARGVTGTPAVAYSRPAGRSSSSPA